MFARRVLVAFVFEELQRADQLLAGEARLNHFVNETALGGDIR